VVAHGKLLVAVRVHDGRSWNPLLHAVSYAFIAGSRAERFGRMESSTSSTSEAWTSWDRLKEIYKSPTSAFLSYTVLLIQIPISLLIHDSQAIFW
jgi:hypothetical protein